MGQIRQLLLKLNRLALTYLAIYGLTFGRNFGHIQRLINSRTRKVSASLRKCGVHRLWMLSICERSPTAARLTRRKTRTFNAFSKSIAPTKVGLTNRQRFHFRGQNERRGLLCQDTREIQASDGRQQSRSSGGFPSALFGPLDRHRCAPTP